MDFSAYPTHPAFKFNLTVSLLDGAFFGFALGFASFTTVLPLFVRTLTDSALLIALIPAIHTMGWQFPQIFLASRIARLPAVKPLVLTMTLHERLPIVGLVLVALLIPTIGTSWALFLTFVLLIWQGLGGGLTANPWQNLIARIIPPNFHGSFYGLQSGAAALLGGVGAIAAGALLDRLPGVTGFAACFAAAGLMLAISYAFLAATREPARSSSDPAAIIPSIWSLSRDILRRDASFRRFLLVRILANVGLMGSAFYTVYAVEQLGMSVLEVGVLTSVLLAVQVLANAGMGWLGDRWNRRGAMALGMGTLIASGLLAWWAPTASWFYPVEILYGIGYVATWSLALALTLEYGAESERPAYIGLANTLVAPFTILLPLLGGLLADWGGFRLAFLASALGAGLTLLVLLVDMRAVAEPRFTR
jgi:MFS family permease